MSGMKIRIIGCGVLVALVRGCATMNAPADGEAAAAEREGKAMWSGRPGFRNRDVVPVRFFAIDDRTIAQREKWAEDVDCEPVPKPQTAYDIVVGRVEDFSVEDYTGE